VIGSGITTTEDHVTTRFNENAQRSYPKRLAGVDNVGGTT